MASRALGKIGCRACSPEVIVRVIENLNGHYHSQMIGHFVIVQPFLLEKLGIMMQF
ncbi:hypothetical protein RINTHM_1980 [Richelia intracellularis HM01]|nr:hypothetical protein RINTHM_1980 [Richelia intracellularis HM01]